MLEWDNVEVVNLTLTSDDNNVEFLLVGAGIGGGFTHTSELKVMNYCDAMASEDAKDWKVEVGEERRRQDLTNSRLFLLRYQEARYQRMQK